MENNIDIFDGFFNGKRVLVTGHTGFKGSWLSIWLHGLGAKVIGVGLDSETGRDNYVLSGIGDRIEADLRADIRDGKKMQEIFARFKPEIVFHLAAQPLVRQSYSEPVETWETNVMGTINILEAVRNTDSVKVGVFITTDKCYENKETTRPYAEDDSLGGYDPYSSSKGACEIAISSWRRSFMNPNEYDRHHKSIASVRAGNVIGGGDWAKDRIIPDCIRAIEAGEPIKIRNRNAVRPWQHVLEPLSGYMLLAKKMWEQPTEYCEAWNFGPRIENISTVWEVSEMISVAMGGGELLDCSNSADPHEASLLSLDISKVTTKLKWRPMLNTRECIELTANWYAEYRRANIYQLDVDCIRSFCDQKQ